MLFSSGYFKKTPKIELTKKTFSPLNYPQQLQPPTHPIAKHQILLNKLESKSIFELYRATFECKPKKRTPRFEMPASQDLIVVEVDDDERDTCSQKREQ